MVMIIKKKPAADTAAAPAVQQAAPAPTPQATEKKAPGAITKSSGGLVKNTSAPAATVAPDPAANVTQTEETQFPKVTVAAGEVTTTKQYSHGAEVSTTDTIGEPVTSVGPMASVEVSLSVTRNLGNYESFKATVGVTIPCAPTAEDIDATYTEARAWADERIDGINAEIDAQLAQ